MTEQSRISFESLKACESNWKEGQGLSDIKFFLVDGKRLNLFAARHYSVWKLLKKYFKENKEIVWTVLQFCERLEDECEYKEKKVDKIQIHHTLNKFAGLGFLYRYDYEPKNYEYFFSDIAKEKGLDWLATDNQYIEKPHDDQVVGIWERENVSGDNKTSRKIIPVREKDDISRNQEGTRKLYPKGKGDKPSKR